MNSSGWVAYVGPFLFPWGQPGSRRVFGIAAALAKSGHRVVVGSGQWGSQGFFQAQEGLDIKFCNLGDLPPPGSSVAGKLIQLFYESGGKTVSWLNSMPTLPKAVIVYGAGAPFMYRLNKWCRAKGVPIVADVVEWYNGAHQTGGYFGPFHISAKVAMHYYFRRCDGVIAISELLARHFEQKSRATVIRVPPITDVWNVVVQETRYAYFDNWIRLVYAGTPGRKDLLGTVIAGVSRVDPEGACFRLQVLGPSASQVEEIVGGAIPRFVEVLGMVPQELVAAKLQEADFSVLIREPNRVANAGFATKFVESLVNGTPVIANHTSDLHMYLQDGTEGVVCSDHTVSSLAEALRRVQRMSRDERAAMRRNARWRAQESFDYRNYCDVLSQFIDGISA